MNKIWRVLGVAALIFYLYWVFTHAALQNAWSSAIRGIIHLLAVNLNSIHIST